MTAALDAWLQDAGERGAEIWLDEDGRLHYRLTAALAASGLPAELAQRAAQLRDWYAGLRDWIGPYRPSPAQAAMWLEAQLAPQSLAHVLRYPLQVRGDLDPAALARALDELARRHPLLCSRIVAREGQPQLFFAAQPRLPLQIDQVEAAGWPRWIAQCSTTPLALDREPLCRFHLAQAGGAALLLLVAHHCVVDFVSLQVVWRELDTLYAAQCGGEAAPLAEPALGLSDLAALPHWQAARPAAVRQREAWRQRLVQLPAPAEAPRASGSGQEFCRRATPAQRQGLQRLAAELGMTPFVPLFTLHALTLLQHSGAESLCLGLATAGRSGHPDPDLVGCFVNSLPLIVGRELLALPPRDAVRRLQAPLREAIAADLLPFIELVRLAPQRRQPGRPLLFSTLFTWLDDTRRSRAASPQGLRATTYENPGLSRVGVTHDLVLAVHERESGLYFNWGFDEAVHSAAAAGALADDYLRRLAALLDQPGSAAESTTAREQFEL